MNAQAKSTQGARDEVGKVLAKIVVMGSNGVPYDGPVNATLISASAKVFLNRVGKFYHTTSIEPGSYQLELTALSAGEVFDPQTIRITQAEETYFAYLGNKQPRYQIGQSLVPLKPRSDLVAVTFDGKRPTAEIFSKLDELFAKEGLKVETVWTNTEIKHERSATFSATRLYTSLSGAVPGKTIRKLRAAVESAFPMTDVVDGEFGLSAIRVGIVASSCAGRIEPLTMDDRFVVRFPDGTTQLDVDNLVTSALGHRRRKLRHTPFSWLVTFDTDIVITLQTLENWKNLGKIIYGEPDYLLTVNINNCPSLDARLYSPNANLHLQSIPQAWSYIETTLGASTLCQGRPNVCVATIDRGIDPNHKDVGGTLSDNRKRLLQCYDFEDNKPCNASYINHLKIDENPDHGSAVYGIIASGNASGNNIVGIAGNTHQLAVRCVTMGVVRYTEVLLWLAGVESQPPHGSGSLGSVPQPADIISLSHGECGPIPEALSDTLARLSTEGRGGKGTVVVCSAGNDNSVVQWLAADPHTISVGNTTFGNDEIGTRREIKEPFSNFGLDLDLCAQGEGVNSLTLDQNVIAPFAGTSAAAPMVAATAALMLSVNDQLTAAEVRDILRAKADNNANNLDPGRTGDGAWGIDAASSEPFSQWYGYGRLNARAAVEEAYLRRPTSVRRRSASPKRRSRL